MTDPIKAPDKTKKSCWQDLIYRSQGTSAWLPEKFEAQAKEIDKGTAELHKLLAQAAEIEIKNSVKAQNVWLEIREFLAKNGHPDVWAKDVGFDTSALKEGFHVINLRDPQGR